MFILRFVLLFLIVFYSDVCCMQEVTADQIFKEINTVSWNNRKEHQADFDQQQKQIVQLIKQFVDQGNSVNKIYNIPQSDIDRILVNQYTKTLLSESFALPIVVKYLVFDCKADVNLKTSSDFPLSHALGEAAIMLASAASHHDCKESALILLFHPDIKVNVTRDRCKTTALHVACRAHNMKGSSDFTKIIKLLIAKGADCEVKDVDENTPGDNFCKYTDNYRSLEELISGLTIVGDKENNTVKVEFDDKESEVIDFDMLNCAPDKPEKTSFWTIRSEEENKEGLLEFVVCQKD